MNKLMQIKKSGSAIALVLIAAVILLATGTGLLGLGMRSRMLAAQTASEITARCAADAGLAKAVFEMNEKLKVKPWDGSTMPIAADESLQNCDATFSYIVTGDAGSGYAIECTGNSGRYERGVTTTLRLEGPWEYAIFTMGEMVFGKKSTVDGYNFTLPGERLKIGTNSTAPNAIRSLHVDGGYIDGDVVVGPGGDPDVVINLSGTISGNTYALEEPMEWQPVIVPADIAALPSKGVLTVAQAATKTITENAKYSSIVLEKQAIAKVNGNVTLYVTGNVTIGNAAELQVVDANTNPNASLTLYLGGNLVTEKLASVNNLTKVPQKLRIFGLNSCTILQPGKQAVFYGAIYAPQANTSFTNASELFGAVATKSFTTEKEVKIHFDASLKNVGVNNQGVGFLIGRWSEQ